MRIQALPNGQFLDVDNGRPIPPEVAMPLLATGQATVEQGTPVAAPSYWNKWCGFFGGSQIGGAAGAAGALWLANKARKKWL